MLCAWIYFFPHFLFICLLYITVIFESDTCIHIYLPIIHFSIFFLIRTTDYFTIVHYDPHYATQRAHYTHTPHRLGTKVYCSPLLLRLYYIILYYIIIIHHILSAAPLYNIYYIYLHIIHCVPVGIESFGVYLCIYIVYIYKYI